MMAKAMHCRAKALYLKDSRAECRKACKFHTQSPRHCAMKDFKTQVREKGNFLIYNKLQSQRLALVMPEAGFQSNLPNYTH